jgi:hypothetical protein
MWYLQPVPQVLTCSTDRRNVSRVVAQKYDMRKGTFYYIDDDHLSDAGTELAWPVFDKILSNLSVGQPSKQSLSKQEPLKQTENP